MNNKQERQRLDALFSDLERLEANPAGKEPEIINQIESLRTRVLELEKYLSESENDLDGHAHVHSADDPDVQHVHADRLRLYDKDRIGYSYSNDQLETLVPTAHPVAPTDTITAPLRSSGQVIGEMQIARPANRELTRDEINLANSIAHQASLQIQNLRLLADAERSRAEAEVATRRFMHEGWDSYLDAINRNERIGYAYDQGSVTPYFNKLQSADGIHKPISLMDESVGTLFLKPDPFRPITKSDQELIDAVADQVAQQVENIRLLADASRARAEAENAIRRLAHENWQKFATDRDESALAFAYDSLQVKPFTEVDSDHNITYTQPLMVNGESIGELAVAGLKDLPVGAAGMISSVAAQASIHLETLRLSEELQKRARELQELDRLKSAFLANMSHELRTPLNSILGFTDVMLEGLDGDLTEYMENDLRLIQKNGQHLLHLINDVLDMAKIESGRMNLHPETFKVHDVLEDVNSITSSLAIAKGISILFDEDTDHDVEIYADNTRIKQVMINLVNNAIKFTNHGGITMRTSRPDGARVLITVKDTGLGIPPEQLDGIFQEFTQVDTSTTRKVGGTGLGLPISRRLIEMHGGKLWADSTGIEGEGSTFFVELPLEARITEVIEKQEK